MAADPDPEVPDAEDGEPADYFVDMVEQLADRARTLGEIEIAIHLAAVAEARRYALTMKNRESRRI